MNGLKFVLFLLVPLAEAFALPQTQGGVIAGQLLFVDGTPAVGVRVAALAPPESVPGGGGTEILASLTMTDGAGHYRLENIHPGQYYVRAGPTDFLSYYPGVPNLTGAKLVAVRANSISGDVNFGMAQAVKVSGHLAAAMSLQSAIPLSAVMVASNGQTLEAPVRPDGTFEFPRVAPGNYSAMTLPNIGLHAGLHAVPVSVARQDVTGIELGGGVGVRVSGRVSGISNGSTVSAEPMPPLRVRMQAPAQSNQFLESAVNSDGTFAFSWVPPGTYALWTIPNFGGGAVASLLVTDREIRGVELKGIDPNVNRVSVSGRVGSAFSSPPEVPADRPLQPTSQIAQLRPLSGSTTLQATIHSDGTFEFPNVGAGFAFALTTSPIAIVPMPVAVSDRDIPDLEFGVDRVTHARVSGRVIRASESAAPLPPVMLLSRPDLTSYALEAAVGPDGKFEFPDLNSGTYLVQTLSSPVATSTIVLANQDVADADIVLPSRFEYSGRVATEDGSSLPSSSANTQFWAIGTTGHGVGPKLQADGSFKLPLSEGEYRIVISGLPIGYFVKSISDGRADLLKMPLKIEGPASAEIRVMLGVAPTDALRGVKVSGHVSGVPSGRVTGASVRLLPLSAMDGPTVEVPVLADGAFELRKVPPGTYILRVIGTPTSNFPLSVVVADEDVSSVAVLMRP